jgi:muramidase (phage lysozyme)
MSTINLNLAAFLATVRHSEGTDKAPDPYRVVYGYGHTIQSLSDHPAITGEWHGESLANLGPAYAGKISTAAGAYQIIAPTWRTCKRILNLPDFTGPSQDAAATELIREAGALERVNTGQVADAIALCHGIWASLPGSTSGQPQRSLAELVQAYTAAGGAFA